MASESAKFPSGQSGGREADGVSVNPLSLGKGSGGTAGGYGFTLAHCATTAPPPFGGTPSPGNHPKNATHFSGPDAKGTCPP